MLSRDQAAGGPRPLGEGEALFPEVLWFDDVQPHSPALNMALDETLLSALAGAGNRAVSLLRVYRWSERAVSLGYFDRAEQVRRVFPTAQLVRRWTGGGVVEHGGDLTYSVLVPDACLPADWRRGAHAYRQIHAAVADALRGLGWTGASASERPGGAEDGFIRECFRHPVVYDLLDDGEKIAGAAQRRTRLGLLHQGSIQTKAGVFSPGCPLHTALAASLPAAFGARVIPWQPDPMTWAQAAALARARYGSLAWLEKF